MSYEFLTLEVADGVGTIWLNRPPANSLNRDLVEELSKAFTELAGNDAAKVLVIASKIPGFFVAGADIKMFAEMNPDQAWDIAARLQEVNQQLEDMPKISIAAVGGYALGGGLELALACDFRFMAKTVTIKDKERTPAIGLPETTLGILPGAGGTQRLSRLLGPKKALFYIANAKQISPDEALQLGLVEMLLPGDELLATTMAFAKELAAKAVIGIGCAKKAIYQGFNREMKDGLRIECDAFKEAFASNDATEGLNAFIDKRPAQFTGK
ncbi:MAG: enoyl-CoA hydratase/isomerase family protein [Deltaproteobacteria bacterium]|nr:enoyl-CoA hydratase/isomerase family protein [Candidatus Anaeroferrophillus wilburensis]MBN2890075.1 enoyl-CoA hydratase/isomerase family protein [Deltaproteobacteria bacterium]